MSIEARPIVVPDSSATTPVEESVLDAHPAPPRPARSEPTPTQADAIQDVLLMLPSEPGRNHEPAELLLTFHVDDPHLAARVAEAADMVFVAAGRPGLLDLEAALRGTSVQVPGALIGMPSPGRGEKLYTGDVNSPRGKLIAAFDTYAKQLPGRRATALAAVQEAAVQEARRRLDDSRRQLREEAARYFGPGLGGADAVLRGQVEVRLKRVPGTHQLDPHVVRLVTALVRIAEARDRVDAVVARAQQAERDWQEQKQRILSDDLSRAGWTGRAEQLPPRYAGDRGARQLARDLAAIPDTPAVTAAKADADQTRAALVTLISDLAEEMPVLHRLWDTNTPAIARDLIRRSSGNILMTAANLRDSPQLRDAILEPLQDTMRAADALASDVAADAESVWQYPALIDATLDALYVHDGDFVTGAARGRLAEEDPSAALAELTALLTVATLAATVTGQAHVAAALGVAGLVVDLIQFARQVLAALAQDRADQAFLRPADRLASPVNYQPLVVDALFLAIGVWGLRGDVRVLRRP